MKDVLETVSMWPLIVEAEFTLFSTEDNGREWPITNGYSPNHNFDWPENSKFYIGRVELDEGDWMYPGETRILNITFFDAIGLRELLSEGREWKIQERSHVVGKAVVKHILISKNFFI